MAVICNISVSLDGFVAGPNQTLEEPLGKGGEGLHEWVFRLKSWRDAHGMEGGETGPDDDVIAEAVERAGATIMGRRMFSSGAGLVLLISSAASKSPLGPTASSNNANT